MRRLRWWWFLARYKVARWRGKPWASSGLLPRWQFAVREMARKPFVLPEPDGDDHGYFNARPVPKFWRRVGDDNGV